MSRARMLPCVLAVTAMTAIAIACGSSDDDAAAPTPDGGGIDSSSSSAGSGGPPPPPNDAGDAGSDGGSSGGEPCGPDRRCKYQKEAIEAASNSPVALALGATTSGVANGSEVHVRVSQGTWASSAGAAGQGASAFLRAAVDANGVQWIAFKDASDQLSVAHGTAGTTANLDAGLWTVETAVASTTYGAGIAIGSDGVPVVVSAGATGVTLARRSSGGTWTPATVATIVGGTHNVALAMNGSDPFVAWYDKTTSEVKFAHATGATTFATETVAPSGSWFRDDVLGIAVDASGAPHVAYKPANDIVYATRAGGVWTTDSVPLVSFPSIVSQTGPVRMAVSPSGVRAIGVAGGVISVSTNAGAGWFTQPVTSRCASEPGLDMAYDASSKLTLVLTCDGELRVITLAGNYPAGYDATCNQVATAACNAACACPHDSNNLCCINKGGQSACIGPSATTQCAQHYAVTLCGDATQDPSVPTTCNTALASPTCKAPDASTPGLELPASCAAPPP